jgi:hypothetical protein
MTGPTIASFHCLRSIGADLGADFFRETSPS